MEKRLILVDVDDNERGTASKKTIHDDGLLHRAFSVFLYNGNKMLVQRRNINKYHSGGLIANSCCSHPSVGENFEYAIRRRLKEELGISIPVNLSFVGRILYHERFSNGVTEFEVDSVFVGEYHGALQLCKEEIEDAYWINIDELKEDIRREPDKYACWFIIALPMVLDHILKNRTQTEKMVD